LTFQTNEVVLAPGASRECESEVWRDALVLVKSGSIVLETRSGVRRTFTAGDVLWFTGIPLRLLMNAGPKPAVLEASRRVPAFG
jgi:hypothetical protein